MSLKEPMVSVRIPSYNHEKYIYDCISSILNQTYQDFEIVIVDDCSTDGTVDVIRSFGDPRIRLEVLKRNSSMNVAVEHCMRLAAGKYVANLSSDDMWAPTKLEKQVAFLESNSEYDAVFTRVELIGEEGGTLKNEEYANIADIFNCENRKASGWLRRFFYEGNCLCNPSVMIKRDVYKSLHYQDKRLLSLSDFDLWVRFSLRHRLWILDEKLTRFRMRDGNANISAGSAGNKNRAAFEFKQILDNFLDIKDTDFLLEIFPECLEFGKPGEIAIPYFLGRLAIQTDFLYHRLWGCEKIFKLLADEKAAAFLEKQYDFRYSDFLALTKTTDCFGIETVERYINHTGNLEQVIRRLENEIDAIHATRSWRATRPLRSLRKLFKQNNPETIK
jgi:glycosyltransferase involved in cell wall biosynthesis